MPRKKKKVSNWTDLYHSADVWMCRLLLHWSPRQKPKRWHEFEKMTDTAWQRYARRFNGRHHTDHRHAHKHLFLGRVHDWLMRHSRFYHHWHLRRSVHHLHLATFFLVIIGTGVVVTSLFAYTWDVLAHDVTRTSIIEAVNHERDEAGLNTLSESPTLNYSATLKAQDMAELDYFAHTSPAGLDPEYWFDEAGYEFAWGGENLAINFTSTQRLVEKWMESPTHKQNILHPEFQDIGIGIATLPDGNIVIAQHFGRLKPGVEELALSDDAAVATELSDPNAETVVAGNFIIANATEMLAEPVQKPWFERVLVWIGERVAWLTERA